MTDAPIRVRIERENTVRVRVNQPDRIRVRVLPSLLPKQVELDSDGTNVRWRYVGSDEWHNLVAIADLAATSDAGPTVTLDAGLEAFVENIGTLQHAVFKFSIPKGADGNDGSGAVDSVNGQTGAVSLDGGDIPVTPTGNLAATDVQAALAELDAAARIKLTADTTYHCIDYPSPMGVGGETGTGTALDPFVGPQFALDWLQKNIDTAGFNVRLDIDSDIATENAPDGSNALQPDYIPLLGGGELTIAFTGGSKITCATSGNGILSVAPFITVENFDADGVDDSVYFTHVIANNGEIDLVGATRFGKAGLSQHQYVPAGVGIGSFGTVEVYGSAASHGAAIGGGTLVSGADYTMTGSPDFSDGFVEGDNSSLIEFLGTFTGPATGALYAGLRGTSITSLNTLPGDAPGTLDATSSYNGVFGAGGGSGTPGLGDSIVKITTSGSHAVAAGTTAIVLQLGSPGSVDLTLPTVSAQAKTQLAISDFAGNITALTAAADAGDTGGVMGLTGAAALGGSTGQGPGLALNLILVPSSAVSGWIQC